MHNIRLDDIEEKDNKSFQVKKKRVFKLELSDGYQTVFGMEYKTISALNSKLSPGVKIQIIGPVQVVNHILLLEAKNISILGGEIEDLLISNAYENVLLRAIGKPTTNDPIRDYKEEDPQQDNYRQESRKVIEPRPMQTSYQVHDQLNGIDFDDEDDFDLELIEKLESENQRNQRTNRVESMVIDDDDGFLAEVDLDDIERNSQLHQDEIVTRPVHEPEILTPPNGDFSTVDINMSPSYSPSCSPIPTKRVRNDPPKTSHFSDEDYKFKSPEGFNMVTTDQYLTLSTLTKAKNAFVIRGSLNKVDIKSMKITSAGWILNADITDEYSSQVITVKFNSKILEKISGHTVQEMREMQSELREKPQLKQIIFEVI